MSEIKIACPTCGQHIAVDDSWGGHTLTCPACQKPFAVPQVIPVAAAAPAPTPEPAGLRLSTPSAPPPSASPQPAPTRPGAMPSPQSSAGPTRTSGLAITSLVLSLLGCFFVTAIAGVICGHIARKKIRRDPSLTGNGLALAGLIIGYVMILLVGIGVTNFTINAMRIAREMKAEMERGGFNISTNSNAESELEPVAPVSPVRTAPLPVPAGPVSGSIAGQKFTYTKSSLNKFMGMLTISDGQEFFAEREIKIFLFPKPGESLADRTWTIDGARTTGNPHVHVSWNENNARKLQMATSGYQLQLKTGPIQNGAVTGSIILKITGKTDVDLKGNFTAVVK